MPNLMKKSLQLAGLLACAVLVLGISTGRIYARITGTQPTNADIFCVGPDGAEVCVDASGNVVPTTTNAASAGSSSLRFSNVFSTLLNISGASTLAAVTTAAITASGTISNTSGGVAVSSNTTANFPMQLRGTYTTTQLSTLSANPGDLAINITTGNLLVSSATTVALTGAWVLARSTSATANLIVGY